MKITQNESLKLLGLFTLATGYYAKLREAEFALNQALGRDGNDQGPMSDTIYNDKCTIEAFYEALANEGVEVKEVL